MGFNSEFKALTHMLARVNIEDPDDRYSILKHYIVELTQNWNFPAA